MGLFAPQHVEFSWNQGSPISLVLVGRFITPEPPGRSYNSLSHGSAIWWLQKSHPTFAERCESELPMLWVSGRGGEEEERKWWNIKNWWICTKNIQNSFSFSIDLRLFDIKTGGKDGEVGGRLNRGAYMTWVWANSGRCWRTWKPGVLQSMGSQSWTWLSVY